MIYDMISFYDGTGTYSYMYWSTGVLTVPRYFGTVDCGCMDGWMVCGVWVVRDMVCGWCDWEVRCVTQLMMV